MELYVLNTNFEAIHYLDTFESLLWAERYNKCGDFEIAATASEELLKIFEQDNYLWSKDSETVMIIEEVQISSDIEEGNMLLVTGRSLESILDRRIIWTQTVLSGNLQDGIKRILDENVISPSIAERKISNFIFEASDDPLITSLTIDGKYEGETVYDVIRKLCETNKIGFKVTLSEANQFVFRLYAGTDRSYDQNEVPYVIFSPKFDNIINSNYLESKKTLKTVVLVAGEGEGADRKTVTVEVDSGGGSGLTRRELYAPASISSYEGGKTMSDSDYNAKLIQNGKEELAANTVTKTFEGEVETSQLFQYGADFFKGDIVQITNEYGVESKTRVVEVVTSQTLDGIDIYPTFETVE